MINANSSDSEQIESYKFHHIDVNKCRKCRTFDCEEACFRGIYRVVNKESEPRSIVVRDNEDKCIKCHICTTKCKSGAIKID